MKTICIILARGGSKGLKRKNVRMLAGKPLIAHSIIAAKQSNACDVVLVTTEDEEIARIAKEYGAEVPFMRPPELADDETPPDPVIQHALKSYEEMVGYEFDIVVYLQPTDVFRTPEMIKQCVDGLKENPELESVTMACKSHKNYWRGSPETGFRRVAGDLATYESRQYRNEYLYREDTGVASASRSRIPRNGKRLGTKVDIVITDDFRTGIDIHSEFDLWLAEKIMTEWEDNAD